MHLVVVSGNENTGQSSYEQLLQMSASPLNACCGWNARQHFIWQLVSHLPSLRFEMLRDVYLGIVKERKRKALKDASRRIKAQQLGSVPMRNTSSGGHSTL